MKRKSSFPFSIKFGDLSANTLIDHYHHQCMQFLFGGDEIFSKWYPLASVSKGDHLGKVGGKYYGEGGGIPDYMFVCYNYFADNQQGHFADLNKNNTSLYWVNVKDNNLEKLFSGEEAIYFAASKVIAQYLPKFWCFPSLPYSFLFDNIYCGVAISDPDIFDTGFDWISDFYTNVFDTLYRFHLPIGAEFPSFGYSIPSNPKYTHPYAALTVWEVGDMGSWEGKCYPIMDVAVSTPLNRFPFEDISGHFYGDWNAVWNTSGGLSVDDFSKWTSTYYHKFFMWREGSEKEPIYCFLKDLSARFQRYTICPTGDKTHSTYYDKEQDDTPNETLLIYNTKYDFVLYHVSYMKQVNKGFGYIPLGPIANDCSVSLYGDLSRKYCWRAYEVLDGLNDATSDDLNIEVDNIDPATKEPVFSDFAFFMTLDINTSSRDIYFLGGRKVFAKEKDQPFQNWNEWKGMVLHIVRFNWETGDKEVVHTSDYLHLNGDTDWTVEGWSPWDYYEGGDILNLVRELGATDAPHAGGFIVHDNETGEDIWFCELLSVLYDSKEDVYWGVWTTFRGADPSDIDSAYSANPRDVLYVISTKGYSKLIRGYNFGKFIRINRPCWSVYLHTKKKQGG